MLAATGRSPTRPTVPRHEAPGRRGGASGSWPAGPGSLRREAVRGSKGGRNSGLDVGERHQRLIPFAVSILQLLLTRASRAIKCSRLRACMHAWQFRKPCHVALLQRTKITWRPRARVRHQGQIPSAHGQCLLTRLAVWEFLPQSSSAKHDDRGQEH